ncbi:disks large homolog 5-like isoform X2 [Corticium candelabrum]|uniref:disks large homolog 5-like isoform X2 n=1 Tax=Corticium candelabrum TaxID=121492 RepID=UPI002E2529F2|nr:disks large homolog 5-like isoform X2 [Corticium candelabrum]
MYAGSLLHCGLAAPQYDHNMMELRTHQASRSVKVSSSNVSTTSSSSSIQVLKVRLEYQQELDLVQAQLETLQVEINKLERALDEEKNDKELIGQDMRRLEHQYRTAKREREEAIVELDQRVKERYDMQQQLEETLRDLDEVTAKNDGLNMQLQQFGVVMKDRDEALVELEKIKKQRDQAISDRKNLAERKAKVESELESTLLRYEEAIKESEGKGEEQKTLTRELTRMQMQKMELQLENSKLRKDVREAVDVHAARERGVASPRDSGVSGDMRGWDAVKLKITLSMSQEVGQDKRHGASVGAGIVLESGSFVKELVQEGIAVMDGQLIVGDRLLEVNGLEVEGRSVDDIHGLIRSCKSDLVLTIGRIVPRTRPIRTLSHSSPNSRHHTSIHQHPTSQRYSSRENNRLRHVHSTAQQDVFQPRTSTLPVRSGYNPLSHHTSDNVSLCSFAYNPDNRPTTSSQRNQTMQTYHHYHTSTRNPNRHVSVSVADFHNVYGPTQPNTPYQTEQLSVYKHIGIRRRSLSTPDPQSVVLVKPHPSIVSSESQVSTGTMLAGRLFPRRGAITSHEESPIGSEVDVGKQKEALSASQSALFRIEMSDSEDDVVEKTDAPEKPVIHVESCNTSTTSPSEQTASLQADDELTTRVVRVFRSPSLDTLEARNVRLSSSGFPVVGSSLTTTDMRLALRGPEVLISPTAKAMAGSRDARRTSTKMPTFLKDPKMADVKKYAGRNCRFVELKTSSVSFDIGFTIIGGRGNGIYVSAIHDENHLESGLRVGDRILELNGIDLIRSTYEKASATLSFVSFGGGAVMCVEYNKTGYNKLNTKSRDDFYVRALFDYHSPEGGEMAFKEGDVLHVKDTMYGDNIDVWLATRLPKGRYVGETGCIPSKSRARVVHSPLDRRNSSSSFSHSSSRHRGSLKSKSSLKIKLKSLIRLPSNDDPKDLPLDTSMSRRPFAMSPSPDQTTPIGEPVVPVNNAMELFEAVKEMPTDEVPGGYEYVERVSYEAPRPVLIVGPLASVMANRLMQEDPMKYSLALPEFFETYNDVQKGLQEHLIIHCSRRSAYGNYACITTNVIKQIAEQNQHCLLDVGPASITRLRAANLKPIIIFLTPKSERKLRSCCMQLNISAVEAHSMYTDAQRIGHEYQSSISAAVSLGSSVDRCMLRVRDIIQSQQNKVDWVVIPE